ncbi:MAG: arginase family protein, partial [Albidovulum sp.]|uniref:arginase family protein n=1 Tax=Albidovulum sp. TaxID=1872424 RepID=UPI003CBC61D8
AFDHALDRAIPQAITYHVRSIMSHYAVPITLGGDHYITNPILKAIAEKHGPVAIIQFDAHSDIWPDDNPDRIDHGTMMYRAVKDGLVDTARSAMVGIRTTIEDPLGVTILDSLWVHEHGPKAVVERLRQIVGNGPVYVTFDIDGLDPAFAPGTGTPVFGGLTSGQVDLILRGLAGIDIIGGDVVEVSPPFDTTGATAVAGAAIALNLICLLAARRGGARVG